MNFYEKPLQTLSDQEWEQICMKCGKCCMCKYREGNVIHFSNYICQHFDLKKGLCSCYDSRLATGECVKVDMSLLENNLDLLPPSCAYRRLYEGRGLPAYHPLLTGCSNSVVKAKQTVLSLPVVPENAREKALDNLLKQAQQNRWDVSEISQKAIEINNQYSLQWLENYPLPSQNQSPL